MLVLVRGFDLDCDAVAASLVPLVLTGAGIEVRVLRRAEGALMVTGAMAGLTEDRLRAARTWGECSGAAARFAGMAEGERD